MNTLLIAVEQPGAVAVDSTGEIGEGALESLSVVVARGCGCGGREVGGMEGELAHVVFRGWGDGRR